MIASDKKRVEARGVSTLALFAGLEIGDLTDATGR
jgi:hypothetical protein